MSTKVVITEEVLSELLGLTKDKDPAKAIQTAVREYIRYMHWRESAPPVGRIVVQEDWLANAAAEPKKRKARK